jgi:DNA-binding transcriptional LysR family regulator
VFENRHKPLGFGLVKRVAWIKIITRPSVLMPNRSLQEIGLVMDATDLRVFEAVARHGSMNRAAAELNTVQSNVTARVRALELELGIQLFQRHARGVKVTPAGRRMLPFSARITKLLSDAKAAARDDGTPGGVLELGTLETTAAIRLPSVLASFTKAYPKVRPVVTTGTTCSLIEDVVECRLEGAFVAGPVDHPDLQQECLFREELVLVTPRSIRSIEELSSINELKTIVFRVGCSYRIRLENLLNKVGILVAQPLEFGSIDAILGCVAAGVGITLLPKGVVVAAWRDGQVAVHELESEFSEVQTVFIRRTDAYVSSALSAFLQIVRPAPELHAAAAE